MNEIPAIPWSFTIEFDDEKAKNNGYNVETLYDNVDDIVQPYGLARIGHNTWKAKLGEEVESQCLALSILSKTPWVMQNIEALTVFENSIEGFDGLEVIRQTNPQRLLV